MTNKKNIKYAAMLRGIMPMNPNMRNEKLVSAFEKIGFDNVRTVISSGNVLFESASKSKKSLESKIEKSLPELLDFTSTAIIRSFHELQSLVVRNPFKGFEDTPKFRLNVTFLKNPTDMEFKFPFRNDGFEIITIHQQAIFSVVNTAVFGTSDIMSWLEKKFGKEITTRTWKTVNRILKKMES